jgi:hypothetical protein
MAVPLRKDVKQEDELTTADLAEGGRAAETTGPKPVGSAKPVAAEKTAAEISRTESQSAGAAPLFPHNELENLRSRWKDIQVAFVDEPRKAVEQADGLVASAMKRLAEVFAEERSNLEKQWDRGDNVSTEDLRVAFQRYRTFFDRLLSV